MASVADGHQYAREVVEGNLVASRWVRFACQRHLDDFALASAGTHPRGLYFDEEDAADALAVFGWVRFYKGIRKGEIFDPEPWQTFIVISLFGWRRPDGTRKYRKAYVEMAKKNGKSHLAAVLALILAFFDGEGGAEVFAAATTKDQARIVFDVAQTMVQHSPELRGCIRNLKHVLSRPEDQQRFHAVSSEAGTLDGKDVHGVVIDELHLHPTSDVLLTMEYGTVSRSQPLVLIITTAGPGNDPTNPCRVERNKATAVLNRFVAEESWESDDELFVFIACLDSKADGAEEDDDWKDPRNWPKANPNLGTQGGPTVARLQTRVEGADPTEVNRIKRYYLGLWVGAAEEWIPAEKWLACGTPVIPKKLEGQPCFAGLDLSVTTDLTALVLYFPKEDEPSPVLAFAWLPEERLHLLGTRDGAPFELWVEQGYLRTTEGDAIDYRTIRADILKLGELYDIKAIAYDPYKARDIAVTLQEDGFEMVKMPQTFAGMHVATARTGREIRQGNIAHGNNPLLSWNIGNAVVEENNSGLIKLSKKKSKDKMDLAQALCMAVGWWAVAEPEENNESRYNDPDVNFEVI